MISVVMATYNGEKYILEQLDSIRNQSISIDEVIICDDCSIDNTVNIIKQYINDYSLNNSWRIIQNVENKGYIHNFQYALSVSIGDIIFLSDQDDIFYPNKFEHMMNYLSMEDCLLLNANYEMIDDKSFVLRGKRFNSPKRKSKICKLDFKKFIYNSNYPGFSIGIKHEIVNDFSKINLKNCYGHDIFLNVLALKKNGCYETREILSQYRIHNSNTSNIGNDMTNLKIEKRLIQKNKELQEYKKLLEFLKELDFPISDIVFLTKRMNCLNKRIRYIKNKNIFKLLYLMLTTKYYPKKTILGDVYYIIVNNYDSKKD